MKERLCNLFKLQEHERSKAVYLLLIQFFTGVALALLFIIISTLFIHQVPINLLYIVFLIAGSAILLIRFFYAYIEHSLSVGWTYFLTIFLSSFIFLLYYFLHKHHAQDWQIIILFALMYITYFFNSMGFWGIASQLFDVRDSKRLFPLISSGDLLSKIVGYALAGVLAEVFKVESWFLLGVGFYVLAGIILYFFLHKFRELSTPFHHGHEEQDNKQALHMTKLENKLILIICIPAFLFAFISNANDYFFYSEIKASKQYTKDLAQFLAVVFAAGRILALFYKSLLSAKTQEKLGLRNNLLMLPVLVILFSTFVLLVDSPSIYYFAVYMILFEAIRFSSYDPYYYALFQPMRAAFRLKGHELAKGFFEPLGLLAVAGLIILLLQITHLSPMSKIAIALIISSIIWFLYIIILEKEYYKFMREMLSKFSCFNKVSFNVFATDFINHFKDETASNTPKKSLIAANYLYQADEREFKNFFLLFLPKCQLDEVKLFVIQIANQHSWVFFTPMVEKIVNETSSSELKTEAIKYLVKLHHSYFDEYLSNAQKTENIQYQIACLTGGIKSSNDKTLAVCRNLIKSWLNSSLPEYKVRALQLLETAKDPQIYYCTTLLFQEEDFNIKQQLFKTIMSQHNPYYLPFIFHSLHDRKHQSNAIECLAHYAEYWVPYIYNLHYIDQSLLLKILIKTKSDRAFIYLKNTFLKNDEFHSILLPYMVKQNVLGIDKKFLLKNILKQLEFIHVISTLQANCQKQLISSALKYDQLNALINVLHYFYLLYRDRKFSDLIRVIEQSQCSHYYYLMETIEFYLNKHRLNKYIKIIECFLLDKPCSFKNVPESDIPKAILNEQTFNYSTWTISVILYLYPNYRQTYRGEKSIPIIQEILSIKSE